MDEETIRAQMQHGYEAIRSLAALAIQMCGFLIASPIGIAALML